MTKVEKSCQDTVFKYTLSDETQVEIIKNKVKQLAGKNPVFFVETPLKSKEIELTVIAARLTPSIQESIANIQNDSITSRKIEKASFDNEFNFDMFAKKKK